MTLQYALIVTEIPDPPNPTSGLDHTYRVVEICFEGEIERPSKSLVLIINSILITIIIYFLIFFK